MKGIGWVDQMAAPWAAWRAAPMADLLGSIEIDQSARSWAGKRERLWAERWVETRARQWQNPTFCLMPFLQTSD